MALVIPDPIEEFGGTVTSDFWTRPTLYRVPMPDDWSGFTVQFRRGNDTNIGPMYIAFTMEDEDFAPIHYSPAQTARLLYANTTHDNYYWHPDMFTGADRDVIRYVGLHAYASGIEGQNPNAFYTFDAFMSITFDAVEIPDVIPVGVVGMNQVSILG